MGEYHPNLIILDIMMPKMNGLDVLKNLKNNPETATIPVIIVTALVQEIEKLNKIMTQADAYIVKSEVLPGEIIEEVKKRLNMAAEMGAEVPTPEASATAVPAAAPAPTAAPAPIAPNTPPTPPVA